MATPQNYLRLKTGLQLEDPGAGTKVTTLSAATALPASYNIVMPPAAAVYDSSPLVVSTTGTGSWSELPHDSVMSGWAAWGGEADYWSYSRATLSFTVEKSGVGYIKGKRVAWTAGQSVTITAGIANYVGVNSSGTVFVASSPNYSDNFYLFEVFDDNVSTYPNGFVVKKENHGIEMNRAISSFLHNTVGTIIRGAGADMVLHAANTDLRIDITGDTVEDHGNATTFATQSPATIRFWYVMNDGTTWREYGSATATFPLVFYNTGTNAVEAVVANNKRVVYRMYATADSLQSNAPTFAAVIHRQAAPYPTLSAANTNINANLITATASPFQSLEWCQLGYVVLSTNTGTPTIEQITIQKNTFNAQFSGGTGTVSSHLTLADLDAGQFRVGGHQFAAQRNDAAINATAAENDTANPGYRTGSIWVNSTDKAAQVCTYSTGTAVWPSLTLTDSSGTGNASLKPLAGTKTNTTILGVDAGAAATAAGGTYIGRSSGAAVAGGTYNTTLGFQAGDSVTSGGSNVLLGANSDGAAAISGVTAVGTLAAGSATGAIAIGGASDGATAALAARAANQYAVSIGAGSAAGAGTEGANVVADYGVCIGYGSKTESAAGITIGKASYSGTGANSIVVGTGSANATWSGASSCLMGSGVGTALTTGGSHVLVGFNAGNTLTDGAFATLVGNNTQAGASINYATAIGTSATASALAAFAGGALAAASGQAAVAIGSAYNATSTKAARATNTSAVAIGTGDATRNGPIASGTNAVAIGSGASAAHTSGIAIGLNMQTAGNNGIIIGSNASGAITVGAASVCIGCSANVSGNAIGILSNTAVPANSMILGNTSSTNTYIQGIANVGAGGAAGTGKAPPAGINHMGYNATTKEIVYYT